MDDETRLACIRSFEDDHGPDGWPAIQMKEITWLLDMIARLEGCAMLKFVHQSELGILKEKEVIVTGYLDGALDRIARLQAEANTTMKELCEARGEIAKLKEFIKTTCDPVTNKIQQRHKATNLAMISSLSVLAALPWLFRPRRGPEMTQKEPD